jgi:CBS domain-containing protein
LLAVELLLFEWRPRSFIPVVTAAVTAYLCRIPLLGADPIFPVAVHGHLGFGPILLACGIGIACGFGSGLLTAIVYFFEDAFARIPLHWMWWPAIGAVFVGIGGWIDPRVLGVGYEFVQGLLRGEILGALVVGLVVGKALVWAIALGSGTSGGVLAPLLIIGGSLGSLIGQFVPSVDPSLGAMIGMAAIMGGTMRSPLTGMFFVLELTHDLNALPALLVGSVAALAVTVLLLKRSILTEKLARRGQHIAREYSVDLFEMMRVSDVMDLDVPLVPDTTPLPRFSARLASGDPLVCRRQGTLLGDADGKLTGIVTRGDVVRCFERSRDDSLILAEVGSRNLIVAYPDETLHDAIAKMLRHDIGRMPVVERTNESKAVGYLGRSSILSARQRYHHDEEFRSRGFQSEDGEAS